MRLIIPLALVLLVTGCGLAPAEGVQPGPGAAPPYSRAAFGKGWATIRGHCDAREVVLERDAGPAAVDTDGDGCKDDGPIVDIYTGQTVDPAHADVDHVFPLELAWESGAWRWTASQRRAFANDLENLRAVGASINRSKGELGPARWRPPARSGWCFYGRTFESTAQRWQLPVSPADQAAVDDLLKAC